MSRLARMTAGRIDKTRVQTQSNPVGDKGGDLDGGEEVASEFVVTRSDPPEILEPAEAALDDVTALVGALVEAMESYSVGLVRDDGCCTAIDDVGAKVVAIVTLVGNEGAHGRSKRKKGRSRSDIGVLTGSQMKCAGSAFRIAQRVDLRGASAARATDRLFMLPPFPPLAERCALIEVESIDKVTLSLPQLAKASKIACHRPRLAQRLKRL